MSALAATDASALCAQVDPALWFPEKGKSSEAAKAVCHTCPVEAKCLTWALDTRQGFGIWGGLDDRERVNLLRRKYRARKAATL